MLAEVDPMVALVESWDTFLVQSPAVGNDNRSANRSPPWVVPALSLLSPPSRTFLSDARLPLAVLDEHDDQLLTSASASAGGTPSLLWLLTLVSRNVELLRATAHLFLQFNQQFAALLEASEHAINDLRERHQQQLASLLEVADSHATSDMIVDTTVTERVVHQQEDELDRLEHDCSAAERQLELQLQETLFTFLNTSAPDAVAAANRKENTLSWIPEKNNTGNSASSGGCAGVYRAEVDVSRFAEVRKPASPNTHQSNTALAPFSPICLVPVRTIKLNNQAGNAWANLTSSSTRKCPNDVTLQPIILDVSPLSGLTQCLTCCSGTQPGAISSSVSSAAEEHLLRLAHTRHSVLLLIGSEAAALEVVAACRAPELLLGAAHTCREGFKPLPHHPVLRVLFTTRLWGANVVLLWSPSSSLSSGASATNSAAQTVVEDALELAYAWDADMFSVAVLEGARLTTITQETSVPPHSMSDSSPSSPAAAFFAGQTLSTEVLRQLRNGVTRELLETAGNRRTRCWQGSSPWLRLGGGSVSTAGTHMCPRAVGVLYTSQAAVAASRLSSSSFAAASSESSPTYSSPASPVSAFRGPPVTFNTPLAIRAFLPLPEEFFIKEPQKRFFAADGCLISCMGRGGMENRGGMARGQAGRSGNGGGAVSATSLDVLTSDLEESVNGDTDFSRGSFTVSTLPRLEGEGFDGLRNSGVGGGGAGDGLDGYGATSHHRERLRDTVNLEALIHHAFGEFAEVL